MSKLGPSDKRTPAQRPPESTPPPPDIGQYRDATRSPWRLPPSVTAPPTLSFLRPRVAQDSNRTELSISNTEPTPWLTRSGSLAAQAQPFPFLHNWGGGRRRDYAELTPAAANVRTGRGIVKRAWLTFGGPVTSVAPPLPCPALRP